MVAVIDRLSGFESVRLFKELGYTQEFVQSLALKHGRALARSAGLFLSDSVQLTSPRRSRGRMARMMTVCRPSTRSAYARGYARGVRDASMRDARRSYARGYADALMESRHAAVVHGVLDGFALAAHTAANALGFFAHALGHVAKGWDGGGGSYMPGKNLDSRRSMATYSSTNDISALLSDTSMTVEDKVCLMIMLIMKKMDQEIEDQSEYINKIQQQSSKSTKKKGGIGGMFGGSKSGGGKSSPSIDVETMKLKRLIDKRGQMFDMLRQIIDKYNETAKNIIQSIGR